MIRGGDGARRNYLQLVHGRDHHRARVDESGGRRDRELEVAEPAALAEARAALVDCDAAGHHEIHRSERIDVNPLRSARALDAARGARVVGETIGVEEEERVALGQPRHGHVDDLAVDQRSLPHRPLR